jgi:BirA family biotin operon repressor/biotin-[acetyl-CoA-carboxylase] ligase
MICQPHKEPRIEPGGGLWGGRHFLFSSLGSTNDWAKAHLTELRHGDVVQTLLQTRGRGRQSRHWIGQRGGLTLSLIVSSTGPDKAPLVGQAAALAVHELLETYGLNAFLKWPNDVMVYDRKIAGILSEAEWKAELLIIGIGLNVNNPMVKKGITRLKAKAISMSEAGEREYDLNEVRDNLLGFCARTIRKARDRSDNWLAEKWMAADWLAGSRIAIEGVNQLVHGRYNGLDSSGRLLLIDEEGVEKAFFSGDVKKVVNEL